MFTGIIRTLGTVVDNGGGRLRIRGTFGRRQPIGASVAVNGVCLTLTRRSRTAMSFDLSPETIRLTNLGRLRGGERVNLEPSLRAGDLLGGHIVTGHVDAAARILSIKAVGGGCAALRVGLPASLAPFVAVKGSITVDGISLTVTGKGPGWFETVLVPHTLAKTSLKAKKAGDAVNLEVDVLARYVRETIKR